MADTDIIYNNEEAISSLEELQSRFPDIYDVYNEETVIYALLTIYSGSHDDRLAIIDRLYAAIGIDDTYDEDLEWRWGSLLHISRKGGESADAYRARLKLAYLSLKGGTAEAIKYAVGIVVGLTADKDIIDKYIQVYDSWDYTNIDPNIQPQDGAFVVAIDLGFLESTSIDFAADVPYAVNTTKASGTQPYVLYFYIMYDEGQITVREIGQYDSIKDTKNERVQFLNTNKWAVRLLNKRNKHLNDNFIISEFDGANVDEFIDRLILNAEEYKNLSFDETILTLLSKSDDESSGISFNEFIKDVIILSAILEQCDVNTDDTSDDMVTNLNIQTGSLDKNTLSSVWSSNELNGNTSLNNSFITNAREVVDVCIDKITYLQ